jgi:microcystin-dependent protein
MGTPFMGEIKIISWNFPPKGWAFCNGQFLPINQNQALFSLFGTMYGGNGQTTFALPDFRGRAPIHVGNGFVQGQKAGQEAHTVTLSEMPQHNHIASASSNATPNAGSPVGNFLCANAGNLYGTFANVTAMAGTSVTNTGGSQPHNNLQPYLVLNFIVALQGVFPSQN